MSIYFATKAGARGTLHFLASTEEERRSVYRFGNIARAAIVIFQCCNVDDQPIGPAPINFELLAFFEKPQQPIGVPSTFGVMSHFMGTRNVLSWSYWLECIQKGMICPFPDTSARSQAIFLKFREWCTTGRAVSQEEFEAVYPAQACQEGSQLAQYRQFFENIFVWSNGGVRDCVIPCSNYTMTEKDLELLDLHARFSAHWLYVLNTTSGPLVTPATVLYDCKRMLGYSASLRGIK